MNIDHSRGYCGVEDSMYEVMFNGMSEESPGLLTRNNAVVIAHVAAQTTTETAKDAVTDAGPSQTVNEIVDDPAAAAHVEGIVNHVEGTNSPNDIDNDNCTVGGRKRKVDDSQHQECEVTDSLFDILGSFMSRIDAAPASEVRETATHVAQQQPPSNSTGPPDSLFGQLGYVKMASKVLPSSEDSLSVSQAVDSSVLVPPAKSFTAAVAVARNPRKLRRIRPTFIAPLARHDEFLSLFQCIQSLKK
jgi:hypothetical protein